MIKITKVLKTIVIIQGEGISLYDTIEYEGKLWLVSKWLDIPSEGYSKPERIICLDALAHTNAVYNHDRSVEADFVLDDPMPKSVFDGQLSEEQKEQYLVIENPEIFVDMRS